MDITLFVTKSCAACDRVRATLEKITTEQGHINLYIEDIRKAHSKGIVIVPALFIEDELYAYGDIDEDRFLDTIIMAQASN